MNGLEKVDLIFKELYPNFNNLAIDEKINASKEKEFINDNIEEIEEKMCRLAQCDTEVEFTDKKVLEEIIKSVKVQKYFDKIYPDYMSLTSKEKLNAIKTKRVIIDNFEEIQKQFEIYTSGSDEYSIEYERNTMLRIVNSIKVQRFLSIMYGSEISEDEILKYTSDKAVIMNNINGIEEKYEECQQPYSVAQKEGWNDKKILRNIVNSIKANNIFSIIYPNYSSLSLQDKATAANNKMLIIENIDQIVENLNSQKMQGSEMQQKGYSDQKIIGSILDGIKVKRYFNILYPDFARLKSDEKVAAIRTKLILADKINDIEAKHNSIYERKQKEGFNDRKILKDVVDSIKVQRYYKLLFPNFSNLSLENKNIAYRTKELLVNNLAEIESKLISRIGPESAYLEDSNERFILIEIVKTIKAQNYSNILYSNFNGLSDNEKAKALNDRKLIYDNIEDFEIKYFQYSKLNSTAKEELSDKRIIEEIVKSIKVQANFERLYPNFKSLSEKDKVNALKDKRIIINHIEDIENEIKKYMGSSLASEQKKVAYKNLLKQIIKNMKVQDYFECLYPDFASLTIDEKAKAGEYKKVIWENIEKIELAVGVPNKSQSTPKALLEIVEGLSSQKKESDLNCSKNIESVTMLQVSNSENKDIENNIVEKVEDQKEYIEVKQSWGKRFLAKFNIINRILKKQKALPKANY